MEKQQAKAVLEAILFTMGESVEVDRLAAVIEEDKKVTKELLLQMKQEYEERDGGVTLIEWEEKTGNIYMTAPSEIVFDGTISLDSEVFGV